MGILGAILKPVQKLLDGAIKIPEKIAEGPKKLFEGLVGRLGQMRGPH